MRASEQTACQGPPMPLKAIYSYRAVRNNPDQSRKTAIACPYQNPTNPATTGTTNNVRGRPAYFS